jgi:hypothetical protein
MNISEVLIWLSKRLAAPAQVDTMAETSSPTAEREKLGDHALEILARHYDMVRLQQEVRDRWYRYYLLTSGAILSLMIAILSSLPKAATGNLKDGLWSTFQMLGWVAPVAFVLIALFGLLFLAVYLPQVVNYQLHYLCIARAQKTLTMIHAQTLKRDGLPDPFTFAYGEWTRAIPMRTKFWNVGTLLNAARKDLQMWGADFFSNLVPICINSLCALGVVLWCSAWRSAVLWNCPTTLTCHLLAKSDYCAAFAAAAVALILQITVRQWLLVFFLWSIEKNFGERYQPTARAESVTGPLQIG